MCKFFSANSNGKGKVEFFKVEDTAKLMAEGNPKNYDWNSHTSIADFHGHKGLEEDKWNKWEYNTETKELSVDTLVTTDDRKKVKQSIERYLKNKDIGYLQNLYNRNSGNMNSGYRNSGYRNNGNMNSGDRNNGNMNSGDMNSGNMNSGDRNSGDRNSGDNNSGCIIGHFSSKKLYFLFNKPCTKKEDDEVYDLNLYQGFNLTEWISENDMTDEEKKANPNYKVTQGYLKVRSYKEAWELVSKYKIEKIKKLKNFNADVFYAITGIKV